MSKRKASEIARGAPRIRKPVQRFVPSDNFVQSEGGKGVAVKKVQSKVVIESDVKPPPVRDSLGRLIFADHPEFTPNLTPREVLQAGSFGGTYFRRIHSGVTGETYQDAWTEFPPDWYEGLDLKRHVASQEYSNAVNRYKVSCGGDLHMWESSGWISPVDPFGWFQWYCRFYLGRRCSDDARQISRGNGVISATGRWRVNLINKCLASPTPLEVAVRDVTIAPKVRQLLLHWGYRLTLEDLQAGAKRLRLKQ
jgi:hypothetical protein